MKLSTLAPLAAAWATVASPINNLEARDVDNTTSTSGAVEVSTIITTLTLNSSPVIHSTETSLTTFTVGDGPGSGIISPPLPIPTRSVTFLGPPFSTVTATPEVQELDVDVLAPTSFPIQSLTSVSGFTSITPKKPLPVSTSKPVLPGPPFSSVPPHVEREDEQVDGVAAPTSFPIQSLTSVSGFTSITPKKPLPVSTSKPVLPGPPFSSVPPALERDEAVEEQVEGIAAPTSFPIQSLTSVSGFTSITPKKPLPIKISSPVLPGPPFSSVPPHLEREEAVNGEAEGIAAPTSFPIQSLTSVSGFTSITPKKPLPIKTSSPVLPGPPFTSVGPKVEEREDEAIAAPTSFPIQSLTSVSGFTSITPKKPGLPISTQKPTLPGPPFSSVGPQLEERQTEGFTAITPSPTQVTPVNPGFTAITPSPTVVTPPDAATTAPPPPPSDTAVPTEVPGQFPCADNTAALCAMTDSEVNPFSGNILTATGVTTVYDGVPSAPPANDGLPKFVIGPRDLENSPAPEATHMVERAPQVNRCGPFGCPDLVNRQAPEGTHCGPFGCSNPQVTKTTKPAMVERMTAPPQPEGTHCGPFGCSNPQVTKTTKPAMVERVTGPPQPEGTHCGPFGCSNPQVTTVTTMVTVTKRGCWPWGC